MANSLLVVNADGPETRVALVENGLLAELYIERKRERGIAGNIYKGRVERVLPGMQAAFINIGLEKSAYIHVSDVRGTPDDLKRLMTAGRGPRRRRRRSADHCQRGADRGPAQGRAGDHRPGHEGAHQHEGRPDDPVHLVAGPSPGVHADGRSHRHLPPHLLGQGTPAAARDRRADAPGRVRASSCAPSPRGCPRRICGPTWRSSSRCGTRWWPRSRTPAARR